MNSILNLLLIAISFCLTYGAPYQSEKRLPTLLISLDGFRSISLEEFLRDNPNSNLKRKFVDVGVKADYMEPSFPTLTFPNHFTIVTGLYMESHGIVGNSYYDPDAGKKVNFLSGSDSLDPRWWSKAEPIWLTAKNQGLKTASFFWTGSEVWSRHPDYFLSYTNFYKFNERCDEVLNWFTKFDMDFVTLYFNEPDHTGHEFGADSNEYRQAIKRVDETIGYLMNLLEGANLLEKLNIIIVSDHGMADMKNKTIIVYDYVDRSLINTNKSIFGIVSNIHPVNEDAKPKIFDALSKVPNLRVFYKEDLPESLHFQNSDRIAPIVAIADEGYVMNTQTQTLKGNHGFDNSVEAMRAIFLARGPSFKSNVGITGLKNVDVYPLLCELIQINCNPNNGTMIPFKDALADSGSETLSFASLSTETTKIITTTTTSVLTSSSTTSIPTSTSTLLTSSSTTSIPTSTTTLLTSSSTNSIPTSTSTLLTSSSTNSIPTSTSTLLTSSSTALISTSPNDFTTIQQQTTSSLTTIFTVLFSTPKNKTKLTPIVLISIIVGAFVSSVAVGFLSFKIYKILKMKNKVTHAENDTFKLEGI